jgi:hypothetical protein
VKQHTDATIEMRNECTRSRSSGISGAAFGTSRRTSSTRQAADSASSAPPCHGCTTSRSLPSTKEANSAALSAMLQRSMGRSERAGLGKPAQAASTSSPIGRFTAKSHGQLAAERMNAPSVGPAAEAAATASAFQAIERASKRRG